MSIYVESAYNLAVHLILDLFPAVHKFLNLYQVILQSFIFTYSYLI